MLMFMFSAVAGTAALFLLWVYLDKRGDRIRLWLLRRLPGNARPRPTIDGYEHPDLLDVIFRKTVAYQPAGAWPEMVGVSSVLDFGGACGIHYKQAVLQSPGIRWAVVETPAMAARAAELSTDRLRFFDSIEAAADWLGDIDVMHSNSALQYADDPQRALEDLCRLNAKTLLWRRMAFAAGSIETELQKSYLSDNGPGRLEVTEKIVQVRRIKIAERTFLDAHGRYDLTARGKDWFNFSLRSSTPRSP